MAAIKQFKCVSKGRSYSVKQFYIYKKKLEQFACGILNNHLTCLEKRYFSQQGEFQLVLTLRLNHMFH